MAEHGPDPQNAAIDWLARQRDPLFDDWDGFTIWLEADAAHAAHYQRLMALDAAIADDLAADPPPFISRADAASDPPKRWRRTGLFATGAAAAFAMLAFLTLRPDGTYEVATREGQRKHISLADGSRIVLNEATRLRLDSDKPRSAELVTGGALFDVVHDPRTRFRVTFDGGMVQNLGTRFTVTRKGDSTEVAVAEGAVAFQAGNIRAELRPGEQLVATGNRVVRGSIATEAIGRWATPRLDYDNAPLQTVAADLSRELGAPVSVSPGAANMRISATIQLDIDVEHSMVRFGPLLGVDVRRDGDGWTLSPGK
ncbi:anti-FecI sigma factor FecR [Sphingopyxis fribergensis]|uniref:Anti-FecI sigma factor FecR n=1 Tax=Sphingopyxis fribergensis TaxID=1515612 RepID=A0A0A7PET4_9SPHN|nr:FecR domain-containing protein [Sphingopyxis fribergensis]AJA08535.1 anti-FecI sigma factor FecR [Sphingopyxis fribergensis]